MRGDILLARHPFVQPPLRGQRDHAHQGLRVHPRHRPRVTPLVELPHQDVLDLAGNVVEQPGEGARRGGHGRIAHQDAETVGAFLHVGQQREGGLLEPQPGMPVGERRADPAEQLMGLLVDDHGVEALFTPEVLVDDRLAHLGSQRNLLDGGGSESPLGKELAANGNQLLPALGSAHPYLAGPRAPLVRCHLAPHSARATCNSAATRSLTTPPLSRPRLDS